MNRIERNLHKLASKIARRYKRKCWWAEEEALVQEAWVAMLRARRTWNPKEKTPLEAYAWVAAARALRSYLWRNSAPVSASDYAIEMGELRDVLRAPLDAAQRISLEQAEDVLHAKRVRERVLEVLRSVKGGEHAERVLIHEEEASNVAHQIGVPVTEVYRHTQRARRALLMDAKLWRMRREEA